MTNWMEIATELHDALHSFMAYDGLGQGGTDDMNKGNWKLADNAISHYDYALLNTETPDQRSKRQIEIGEQVQQDCRLFGNSVWQVIDGTLQRMNPADVVFTIKQPDEISAGGSFPAHRISDRPTLEQMKAAFLVRDPHQPYTGDDAWKRPPQ